jgi:hypothetical protein
LSLTIVIRLDKVLCLWNLYKFPNFIANDYITRVQSLLDPGFLSSCNMKGCIQKILILCFNLKCADRQGSYARWTS